MKTINKNTQKFSVYIRNDIYKKIKSAANKAGLSMSAYILSSTLEKVNKNNGNR